MDDWIEDDFFWRFRRTRAKAVKGGIKAQTKKFGNLWWAQKWLEAIEKFGPTRRVARGRSYARKGQALDLNIVPGGISATVQGSREEPYKIEIRIQQIPPEIKKQILQQLRTQPIYAATLLTGEVPPEIENLFGRFDVPLFPSKTEGRLASCSCPDISNPCKHIAAIYYLISLELERDPFLLLSLRGITREDLAPRKQQKLFPYPQTEPLPADPQQFWRAPRLKQIPVTDQAPAGATKPSILQRLGPFPFWRGEQDFLATMQRLYIAASGIARSKIVKQPKA